MGVCVWRKGSGGRRPRSSEARGPGKPQEGGRGEGAGAGWQLQGSPAARAGGGRPEREQVPASPQPARRVRGLPSPPVRSLSRRAGPRRVRWGRGLREAPGPMSHTPSYREKAVPRHQGWPLWRPRSRGSSLRPLRKPFCVSGKRQHQHAGPRPCIPGLTLYTPSLSWGVYPGAVATTCWVKAWFQCLPVTVGYLQDPVALRKLNRGTRELQEGS